MSNSLFNCLSPQRAVGSGSICLYTDLVTIESWTSVSGRGQTVEVVQVRGSIRGLKWGKGIRKREYREGEWEWGKGTGSSETSFVICRQKCNLHLLASEQQRVRITHMHKTIYFCYFSTLYLNLKPSLHNFSFESHAVQQALPRKTPIVHSHPCLKWDLFWIHITTRQLSKMPVSTCHMSHTNSTVTYLGRKTPQQWERGRQNPCILFVLSAWLEKYFNASVKRLFHLKQSKLSQVGSSWNNNSFC